MNGEWEKEEWRWLIGQLAEALRDEHAEELVQGAHALNCWKCSLIAKGRKLASETT